jgi:hypothetical protein
MSVMVSRFAQDVVILSLARIEERRVLFWFAASLRVVQIMERFLYGHPRTLKLPDIFSRKLSQQTDSFVLTSEELSLY